MVVGGRLRKVIDEDGTDEIACMNFKYRKIRKKKMLEKIYRNPAPIGRKPGRQQIATGHARWRASTLGRHTEPHRSGGPIYFVKDR